MRTHTPFVIRVVSYAVLPVLAYSAGTSPPDQAEQLLAQARHSVGVGLKANTVKSLVITGGFTTVGTARKALPQSPPPGSKGTGGTLKAQMVPADDVGDVRLSFMLPDRFRQDYTYWNPNGQPLWTRASCRDGDDVWLDNRVAQVIPEGMSVSVEAGAAPDATVRRNVRFAHARYLLALLLYTDPSFPITFRYAGKAEAPDGRADVLDGDGPDGFVIRLFLDEKTHRPMMMTYGASSTGQTQQLRMEEYRETAGIFFPHLLSRSVNGKLREQLRLEKFVVNGRLDARDFRK